MTRRLPSAHDVPDKQAVIVVMADSDIPVGTANPAPTIFEALASVVTPDDAPE